MDFFSSWQPKTKEIITKIIKRVIHLLFGGILI